MTSDIRAELKNLTVSAQKVRLVIDLVRGKRANDALDILTFTNKGSAADRPQAGCLGSLQRRREFWRQSR